MATAVMVDGTFFTVPTRLTAPRSIYDQPTGSQGGSAYVSMGRAKAQHSCDS